MRTTEWKTMEDGCRIQATYGITDQGYISVCGEIRGPSGGEVACGQLCDEIREYFPELTELMRFHLASKDGIPMHYVANSLYWWELHHGIFRTFPYSEPEHCISARRNLAGAMVARSDDSVLVEMLATSPRSKASHAEMRCIFADKLADRLPMLERELAGILEGL